MRTISYSYNEFGYEVLVWDEGRCIHEYRAGNHKLESSQQTRDPRWMVSLFRLKRFARQTAREMAKEYRVSSDMIDNEGYVNDVER